MGTHNKPQVKSPEAYDLVYAKDIYCYLQNNNKLVKFIKRKMNKRFRRIMKKINLDE